MVDWSALAKRKYDIKKQEADVATMRGRSEVTTAERRYGEGGLEERHQGLMSEELKRRYPYGLPQETSDTARISATGYAGSAEQGAETAQKRLELEREKFEYSKSFLESGNAMPGSPESEANEVAKIRKQLMNPVCPDGFTWNGTQCAPNL